MIEKIEQKSIEDYKELKEEEIPLTLKLLIDSYERRISELLGIIKDLTEKGKEPIHIPRVGTNPLPIKGRISTSSQLIAEMEKRTLKRVGE